MIRQKENSDPDVIIDLDGPDGNAFALMGIAKRFGKISDFDTDKIIKEMQEDDYINLLKVFDYYFGDIVILETENDEYIAALS